MDRHKFPPVLVGERIIWLGSGSAIPQGGVVKWIGNLPEMSQNWTVGIRLDQPLICGGIDGTWGNRQLFNCEKRHGLLAPASNIIRESEIISQISSSDLGHDVARPFRRKKSRNKRHVKNNGLPERPSRRSSVVRLDWVREERHSHVHRVTMHRQNDPAEANESPITQQPHEYTHTNVPIHQFGRRSIPRPTSSGFFSFLRWFRRGERHLDEGLTDSEDESTPASPLFSSSESVDSIFSTATAASFAYVHPATYRPYGPACVPEKLIAPGPDTDTYRRRLKQRDRLRELDRNLTLRKKYRLFAAETLRPGTHVESPEIGRKKFKTADKLSLQLGYTDYSDLSLPNARQVEDKVNIEEGARRHRRTASDSSKDKKSGAYLHVKGKRRAPPPPVSFTDIRLNISSVPDPDSTLPRSTTSTASRKKRQAPQPPILLNELFPKLEQSLRDMDAPSSSKSDRDKFFQDVVSNDSLKLDRGVLKPAKKIEDMSLVKELRVVPPVSPRPWYKRTGLNKEHRKDKTQEKSKDKENTAFPEFNYSRNSISSEGNSRFSFFSKLHDKSEDKRKDTEKRKSGVSILANISELDREAAEIINKQQARQQAIANAQDDQFYEMPSFLRNHVVENEILEEDMPKRQSTKELISRFNAITNVTKVTVNTAFFGKDSSRLFAKSPKKSSNHGFLENDNNFTAKYNEPTAPPIAKVLDTPPMKRSIFSTAGFSKPQPITASIDIDAIRNKEENIDANTKQDSSKLRKSSSPAVMTSTDTSASSAPNDNNFCAITNKLELSKTWTCQRCTLENPRWRAACNICDMRRPSLDENGEDKIKRPKSPELKPSTPKKTFGDWERELKKYFPAKNKNLIDDSLKKSSSDTAVPKPKVIDVIPKNSKQKPDAPLAESENFNTMNDKKNDPKDNGTTISTNLINPNMEEVRKVRLARFSANLDNIKQTEPRTQVDAEEQERLFAKLREMKNSLPKSQAINKNKIDAELTPKTSINQNKYDDINISKNDEKQIKKKEVTETPKVIELLAVTTHTEFEDIKVRNENRDKPVKVSSSCQTSGVIRKIPPNDNKSSTKLNSIQETILPIIPDASNAPEIRVKNRIYELIRPRDFANIKGNKIDNNVANNVYANISLEYQSNDMNKYMKDGASCSKVSDKTDFDKLTEELNKPLGLEHFKVTLQNRDVGASSSTLAVNKLLRNLENAIAEGRQVEAARLAKDLANMKVNCSVTRQRCSPPSSRPINLTLDMYVEDKISHQGPISIQVSSTMTVFQLKEKIGREFEIPIPVQRWILGNQLASNDTKTLEELGINDNGTPIYLYLVAPDGDNEVSNSNSKIIVSAPGLHESKPSTSRNFIEENDNCSDCESVTTSQNSDGLNANEFSSSDSMLDEAAGGMKNRDLQYDWTCTTCTLNNSHNNNKCTVCNAVKPSEEFLVKERSEKIALNKDEHYLQLLNLDNTDVVSNLEPFKCGICFDQFGKDGGVILRECLHTFCRECLANTVQYNEEAEVKCPYRDDQYACDCVLQEREIKALVSPDVYEQHLAKSIAQAENRTENAFHCKTPNCLGWCIFEDNVNVFLCPVCLNTNCLTCQAIHVNLDCREYQEKMKQDSETNVDARRTKQMLKEMVDKGEALTCPTCQVILMKKWGCDWVRCSMCKTEICWVTRGPRWGPNGKGDLSGGCKCGVDGRKCHAKCNYCH